MGWVVLGVVVLLVAAFLWRHRRRLGASTRSGPISRDASTNYAAIQRDAQGQQFDNYRGGI